MKGQKKLKIGSLLIGGAFVDEGLVPQELQLENFTAMRTCPNYNFNGDCQSIIAEIYYSNINILIF